MIIVHNLRKHIVEGRNSTARQACISNTVTIKKSPWGRANEFYVNEYVNKWYDIILSENK